MVNPGRSSIGIDGASIAGTVRFMVPGTVSGATLALSEPLSFWGGFEAESGRIIDRRHPQVGTTLTGRVVVMRAGRGSSSASSVIAEAIRAGTAPAAIVMEEIDEIVALGAIVADELYGLRMPVVVVDEPTFTAMAASSHIAVSDGSSPG